MHIKDITGLEWLSVFWPQNIYYGNNVDIFLLMCNKNLVNVNHLIWAFVNMHGWSVPESKYYLLDGYLFINIACHQYLKPKSCWLNLAKNEIDFPIHVLLLLGIITDSPGFVGKMGVELCDKSCAWCVVVVCVIKIRFLNEVEGTRPKCAGHVVC